MNRTSNLKGLHRVKTMCIFLGCFFLHMSSGFVSLFLEAISKATRGKNFYVCRTEKFENCFTCILLLFFFFLIFYCILYIRPLNLCKRVNKLQRVDDLNEFEYCFFIIIDQERVDIFLLPKIIQLE